MNKFLTSTDRYKERLEICKGCEHYFKLTGSCKLCGCFMRVKAKISAMSCAANPKKWLRTSVLEDPEIVSEEIKKEIIEIMPEFRGRTAKNHQIKAKMINIYNTLYGTGHSTNTNCSSCLNQIYDGVNLIYKKYITDE